MNKLLTLLLTGMLAFNTMQITPDAPTEVTTEHIQVTDADIAITIQTTAEALRAVGIDVPDDLPPRMIDDYTVYHARLHQTDEARATSWDRHFTTNAMAGSILLELGLGEGIYAENGWTQIGWTPTSHQIYAFDAEVYDPDHMYTWLLLGIESIVPDLHFDNVTEDLSANVELDFDYEAFYNEDGTLKDLTDEELALLFQSMPEDQGNRSVSFTVNNHPHTLVLKNYYDWIDADVLDKLNGVLQAEGFDHWLHSFFLDQMVIVCYGPQDTADELALLFDLR